MIVRLGEQDAMLIMGYVVMLLMFFYLYWQVDDE